MGEGPAGNPSFAPGPGRGVQGAAQRRCGCGRLRVAAARGPTCGGETGRGSRQPPPPSRPGLSLGCCRPGEGTPGARRPPPASRCPGAPGLRSRDRPRGRGGGADLPLPHGGRATPLREVTFAFPASRDPDLQRGPTGPLGSPPPCPPRLPRGARRADTPGGASLSAVPEPPQLLPATRGEPSVVSADRLKQRNQSSVGRSVAPRDGSARGRGVWGLRDCPVRVQGKGSWNPNWPLARWLALMGDRKCV